MEQLGFFMDQNGNTFYFGTWTPIPDPNNPHEHHIDAFESEIAQTPFFEKLNLFYEADGDILRAGISFSLQGMILFLNTSEANTTKFLMYTPEILTKEQIENLRNLYSFFSSFEHHSIHESGGKIFRTIDEYFEVNSIQPHKTY